MSSSTMRMASAALLTLITGCGLIDSDVTTFDLNLPAKQFTIDATGWQVDQAQADALLAQSCSATPTVCAQAAMAACGDGCDATCNPQTNRCDLVLDISLYRAIDLVTEKPELKSIDDQPVIEVSLQTVTYEVTSNTLNTATPEMTVYVAPMSVMDPMDPQAKPIGTIPSIAAAETTTMPVAMTFTSTGRADLIAAMRNFKTPFNVIVGSTITVMQGDPVPTGKLDAVVNIRASASL